MRVGIVTLTRTADPQPADLLRAEFLAASVRQARHKPVCLVAKIPLDPSGFLAQLSEHRPHVVFYYVPPTAAGDVGEVTELAYRHDQGRPQFLLGPWPTIAPHVAIKCGPINGLLRGECDLVLTKLLGSLSDRDQLKALPGLWLRRGGGRYHVTEPQPPPSPDQLPVPDFHGFDWPALAALLRGALPAEASRGHRFAPTLGISSALRRVFPGVDDKRFYRVRPVSDIMRDIQSARMRFDPLRLIFVDELFPYDPTWIEEFCTRYRKDAGLPFSAKLAVELHGGDSLHRLIDVGLSECSLDIVCGDADQRGRVGKVNLTNETIHMFVQKAHKRGLKVTANVVVGLPGETRELMNRTDELVRSVEFDAVSVRPYEPVPGSELFDAMDGGDDKDAIQGVGGDSLKDGTVDSELADSVKHEEARRLGLPPAMDVSYHVEKIYRLNLERQAADYKSKRGYFSAIELLAEAHHRVRNIEHLSIQRRHGDPAFTQTAPAESAFPVIVRPGSIVAGALELLAGEDQPVHGIVEGEIMFLPQQGGEIRVFSARLGSRKSGRRVEFEAPLRVTSIQQGLLVFSLRDAGGGDGLTALWIDPVLDVQARGPEDSHLSRPPRRMPRPDDTGEYVVSYRPSDPEFQPEPGLDGFPKSDAEHAPPMPAIRVANSGRVFGEGSLDERVSGSSKPPDGTSDRRRRNIATPVPLPIEAERDLIPPRLDPVPSGIPNELEMLRQRNGLLEEALLDKLRRMRQIHLEKRAAEEENRRVQRELNRLRSQMEEIR